VECSYGVIIFYYQLLKFLFLLRSFSKPFQPLYK
jgi:hypothetical protein